MSYNGVEAVRQKKDVIKIEQDNPKENILIFKQMKFMRSKAFYNTNGFITENIKYNVNRDCFPGSLPYFDFSFIIHKSDRSILCFADSYSILNYDLNIYFINKNPELDLAVSIIENQRIVIHMKDIHLVFDFIDEEQRLEGEQIMKAIDDDEPIITNFINNHSVIEL
jgi:hypothetical protein